MVTLRIGEWCMGLTETEESSFSEAMRRRLVEEFAVSFYNGSLKPNLAEKNPINGRDIEYLMDGPQFEKVRRSDVWSYGNAVGTGYQYRVVYKDKRFSDLEKLLQMYSGTVQTAEGDKPLAEQGLYEMVLLMIKESRLPKTFKIQSAREVQEGRLLAMVEELGRSMDELGRRVKELEERLSAHEEPEEQANPAPTAIPNS
jgi:hypothetical protein